MTLIGYVLFWAVMHSGSNIMNIPGFLVGGAIGAWKGVRDLTLGASIISILYVAWVAILTALQWLVTHWQIALFIAAIDTLTFPYPSLLDMVLTVPLAFVISGITGWSLITAAKIAYAVIFLTAALYVVLYFTLLKKT